MHLSFTLETICNANTGKFNFQLIHNNKRITTAILRREFKSIFSLLSGYNHIIGKKLNMIVYIEIFAILDETMYSSSFCTWFTQGNTMRSNTNWVFEKCLINHLKINTIRCKYLTKNIADQNILYQNRKTKNFYIHTSH